MKTSVRFLGMLLAIVMIVGAALTATANAEKNANEEALQLLVDLGVFGGYEDGSLKPDSLVERDEMAKIIFVLNTTLKEAGEGTVSFKDVPASNWASGYISWCATKGIIGGYGNGNFGPDDHVTYDQALKMVCGALGYTDWNSNEWPIDVRTKALRDLELGENITGVDGSAKVTRAQIAQIAYNALFVPMNEKKDVDVIISENLSIPATASKVLAVDVWGFSKASFRVDAAGDIGEVEEDKDVSVAGIDVDFTLEELGIEEYADKMTELVSAEISFIYDNSKISDTSDLEAKYIYATSVTVKGEKDVALKYDDKKDVLYIGDKKADENLVRYTLSGNEVVETPVADNSIFVDIEDKIYKTIAYDMDNDGLYDALYLVFPKAYKVSTTNENKTSFEDMATSSAFNVFAEDLITETALEEDDIVVGYYVYDDFVVDTVVDVVSAKATKYNSKKVTLDGVGVVEINSEVFEGQGILRRVEESVMTLNEDGETEAFDYYIYNGKVFYSENTADDTVLQFAVLSYFKEKGETVYNAETAEFETPYTALVTIDGVEKTVNVAAENSIDGRNLKDEYEEIYAEYGFKLNGKYAVNYQELVTYKVDDDGFYTFTTTLDVVPEDYRVIPEDATLRYNKDSGLYVASVGDTVYSNRVVMADTIMLYSSYTLESTGLHKYLKTYTIDVLPSNIRSMKALSKIYCVADPDTNIWEIKAAVIDDETIKIGTDADSDYRKDSRLFFYSYGNSNVSLAENGTDLYYSYFMRPIYNGSNISETVEKSRTVAEGAVQAKSFRLYAWDDVEEKYFMINKKTVEERGIKCIDVYTIEDIINGVIITTEGEAFKVEADTSIWALSRNSVTGIGKYTIADIASSLEVVADNNETEGTTDVVKAIIGTHLNDDGEVVASTIIFDRYIIDPDNGYRPQSNSGNFLTDIFENSVE